MRFGSRQGCAIAILTVLLGPSQSRMNVDELSLTLVYIHVQFYVSNEKNCNSYKL